MSSAPVGLLTVGESPRNDVEDSFRSVLGSQITFVQAGGLDGLTAPEIRELAPREGETPLETRLADGSGVLVAKERMTKRLVQAATNQFNACSGTVLLCSGTFPGLTQQCPNLVEPKQIIRSVVAARAHSAALGVIGPASDVPHMLASWEDTARQVHCAPASPYGPEAAIVAAARWLSAAGAHVIVLDCIGFSERHRLLASASTSLPVICATTVVARLIPELFATP